MDKGRSSGVIEIFIQRVLSAFMCLTCLGCFGVSELPAFATEDAGNSIDLDAQSEDTSVPNSDVGITDSNPVDADFDHGVASDMSPTGDTAMPPNADAMPQNTDAMPKNADAMPQDADAMPQDADAMPQNADAMPQNADAMMPIDAFLEASDAGCTPSDEVCDGQDNDCDGEVDEDNVCLCERDMDSLFYICMVAVDWHHAHLACAAAGDGLAVIETAEENQLALALIRDLPAETGAWIGLNDIETEDTFVWYDMNPAQYRPWRGHQPDNTGEEDCVEVQAGGWNDFPCDSPRPFICRDLGRD